MITNLQKTHNRAVLQTNFRLGLWPYENVVPKEDIDAGFLSYCSLAKTLGTVIPAQHIFENATFEASRVLLNGKDVRNRKKETFCPMIVSEFGRRFLLDYTNETVYESFGVTVWMFPTTGKDWRTVYTEIAL